MYNRLASEQEQKQRGARRGRHGVNLAEIAEGAQETKGDKDKHGMRGGSRR